MKISKLKKVKRIYRSNLTTMKKVVRLVVRKVVRKKASKIKALKWVIYIFTTLTIKIYIRDARKVTQKSCNL